MIYRFLPRDPNDSNPSRVRLMVHYSGANPQEIIDFLNGQNAASTPRFSSGGYDQYRRLLVKDSRGVTTPIELDAFVGFSTQYGVYFSSGEGIEAVWRNADHLLD